jgi:hypothetical protein
MSNEILNMRRINIFTFFSWRESLIQINHMIIGFANYGKLELFVILTGANDNGPTTAPRQLNVRF